MSHQANSIDGPDDARAKFINYSQIRAALSEFTHSGEDKGGFRLLCDDYRAHNVLVRSESDLTIVAMLDWEWSYAAPYQLFSSPPPWLAFDRPRDFEMQDIELYGALLQVFLSELRHQEDIRLGPSEVVQEDDQGAVSPAKVPPVPDPTGKRLSWLMKENWDSGRFWFHEIIRSAETAADYLPWKCLVSKYPYLEGLYVLDENAVNKFIQRKLNDLEEYTEDCLEVKRESDAWNDRIERIEEVVDDK